MKVTLGGDRLGSGKKQKLELSHYNRASFNLEQDFKSSLAPGILYPCLGVIGTNGDTFDIDVDSFIRTLPTKGPLFGSFKLQVDLFSCPFRLYQGILHNNPVNIGLKMSQVYLPKLEIETLSTNSPTLKGSDYYTNQIAPTALLKYLGLSGIGKPYDPGTQTNIKRKFNAIPALAYYDIFKNYYANKQEENAYVIVPSNITSNLAEINTIVDSQWNGSEYYNYEVEWHYHQYPLTPSALNEEFDGEHWTNWQIKGTNLTLNNIWLENADTYEKYKLVEAVKTRAIGVWADGYGQVTEKDADKPFTTLTLVENAWEGMTKKGLSEFGFTEGFYFSPNTEYASYSSDITLQNFKLDNIDKMRNRILKLNELGDELVIDDTETLLPYKTLVTKTTAGVTLNAFKQNGLVVKTYQSDLFNNWVNTDWIEGPNGIAAISSVDVSGGTLSMDALNLAQKVYEMLNRVAVTGGTYEDWQEAVYDETAVRKAESPMYIGGMSAEVMFEEVISSAETSIDGDFQALGSLGGKGTQVNQNGGKNITVHFKEPGLIMGIVSLTPRICQTQGNEWYLTELDTLNDLHKPGLDGIGFQDLIVEQMAWWDTAIKTDGTLVRHSAGKVPAWINYTTAVDKAYGDFAEANGKAFMVLARNYEANETTNTVNDITTYIDPAKFNYAFAYTDLAAQNFWAQVHFKIVARRKMSAHQIPNL